jgi:hypothetical protein
MDEKALEVAYKLFVKDGYNKSIGDFKTLVSTNPKALDVSYKLFVKDGYNGDISKYKNLLGVGELETIGTPKIKKKEQVSTSRCLVTRPYIYTNIHTYKHTNIHTYIDT